MICIIAFDKESENINPEPKGWIIATDNNDARRKLEDSGDTKLAGMFHTMPEVRQENI